MPAYNAERTLLKTYNEVMEQNCVDLVILVDDASTDKTVEVAKQLKNIKVIRNEKNLGYGGNQKRCYKQALDEGADIVIMVHPDYQYTPKLIPAMVSVLGNDLYQCVLGFSYSWRICFEGRYAYLEISLQSRSNCNREHPNGWETVRISYRLQGIY